MALITRYIDTAVVGGDGDGTSWANAYATLELWNAAEATNLVTATNQHIVYCRGATADGSTSSLNGWTTSATYDLTIQAADSDRAVKSALDVGRYWITETLTCNTGFVTIDGIQIWTGAERCIDIATVTAGGVHNYSNCYFKSSGTGVNGAGFIISDGDVTCNIWNCVIAGDGYGIYGNVSTLINVFNCIIYGSDTKGVYNRTNSTLVMKNCAVFNHPNDVDDAENPGTIDYCASDDGDGTNAIAASGGDWLNEFTNAGSGNFTLVEGGNCHGGGVEDPGSGLYSTDIDGDTYNDPWSVGVDHVDTGPAFDRWKRRRNNIVGSLRRTHSLRSRRF